MQWNISQLVETTTASLKPKYIDLLQCEFSSVSILVMRWKPKIIAVDSMKNIITSRSVKIGSNIPNITLEATHVLHHSKKYIRRKLRHPPKDLKFFFIADRVNLVLQADVFSFPSGTNLGPIPWDYFRD